MAVPRSLSGKIDELELLREEIRVKKADVKALEEEYDKLEEKILLQMDAQQCQSFKALAAQGTISMSVVPIWDAENPAAFQDFSKYVLKNDALYLLEKRVAVKAWRELIDAGKTVPGLVPFVKRRLHLTTLKKD